MYIPIVWKGREYRAEPTKTFLGVPGWNIRNEAGSVIFVEFAPWVEKYRADR
jgi:hypothetical protein